MLFWDKFSDSLFDEVCDEICDEVFDEPCDELTDGSDGSDVDAESVKDWLGDDRSSSRLGCGSGAIVIQWIGISEVTGV